MARLPGVPIFRQKIHRLFHQALDQEGPAEQVVENAEYRLGPRLLANRILALTDKDSPNSRSSKFTAKEIVLGSSGTSSPKPIMSFETGVSQQTESMSATRKGPRQGLRFTTCGARDWANCRSTPTIRLGSLRLRRMTTNCWLNRNPSRSRLRSFGTRRKQET